MDRILLRTPRFLTAILSQQAGFGHNSQYGCSPSSAARTENTIDNFTKKCYSFPMPESGHYALDCKVIASINSKIPKRERSIK